MSGRDFLSLLSLIFEDVEISKTLKNHSSFSIDIEPIWKISFPHSNSIVKLESWIQLLNITSTIQSFQLFNFQLFNYSTFNYSIIQLSTIQLFNFSTIQLFNYSTIQILNYSTFQLFNYSTIQIFNYSNFQLFNFSSIQFFSYNSWKVE